MPTSPPDDAPESVPAAAPDLLAMLGDLYADERHWTLVARWDEGYAAVTDRDDRARFAALPEAVAWLGRQACRANPKSAFAAKWAAALGAEPPDAIARDPSQSRPAHPTPDTKGLTHE